MSRALITNIQRCSTKDGPGIRTTVFFKGCPLQCIWCHNPETQSYNKEIIQKNDKCTLCKICLNTCSNDAIYVHNKMVCTDLDKCIKCGKCVENCVNNARDIIGKEYTPEELLIEIKKDEMFYEESGGGVTLSGGEVMSQFEFVKEFLVLCYKEGISVAIDTCGYCEFYKYESILKYVDLFLYDLKILDPILHKKYIGKTNDIILENLKKLSEAHANINLRLPIIDGINAEIIQIEEIIKFIRPLNIIKINLLPYHDIGVYKYFNLNRKYTNIKLEKPNDELMRKIKLCFEKKGYDVQIGG